MHRIPGLNSDPTFIPGWFLVEYLKRSGLYTVKVQLAIAQAIKSHGSKLRKSNQSYLYEHVWPVTLVIILLLDTLGILGEDKENIVITAILHDVLEDDRRVNYEQLKTIFGEKIAYYVKLLTKSKEDIKIEAKPSGDEISRYKFEVNRKYLQSIADSKERIPIIVKFADRLMNARCLWFLRVGDARRCISEIETLFLPLSKKLVEEGDESLRVFINEFEEIVKQKGAILDTIAEIHNLLKTEEP